MAWSKPTRFEYWSYSGLTTWEGCAYKAKLKQLDKLKEPSSPPMERGNVIHKEGEDCAKNLVKTAPKSFGRFGKELLALRKTAPVVETTMAFDRRWVRVPWNAWDKVWVRVKMDLHKFTETTKTLVVIDYKTGKDKSEIEGNENKDQMDLYGLAGMLAYPDVKVITTRLWYVDHGTEATDTVQITPKSLAAAKKRWEKRVAPMMADTHFAKSPSRLCSYCHFRASNGGPCDNG